MKIVLRFSIVIIAMILCGSACCFSALSSYDRMQCVFYSQNDLADSCLLGHKRNICGALKCYKTIGQPCSTLPHDIKLIGNECASSLVCGCDRRCNGCMTVNGQEKCHYAEKCMPFHKRSDPLNFEKAEQFEYPPDESGMVNFS